ncbi:Wzz/FepE/Etk N-terminal domain-containing protein [Bermanella sp. R86510]|uniref:Wzz/FepE/Etk N-terminal domain-containing protein n=1 Tax=unclassified Bermanella TaxID=2627862 RepID=UPI0037CA9950
MTDNRDLVQGDADFRDNRSDEIDLFDLWDDIVDNKLWVVAGLVGCLLLAALYLVKATPVFETRVVVKPPSENHVLELNQPQLVDIYEKNVEQAYADARSALLSKELRRDFYQANLAKIKELPSLYNENRETGQNFIQFDKHFSSSVSSKKDVEEFVEIRFQLTHAEKAAQFLNSYTEYVLGAKLAEVENTISNKVQTQIKKLEYDASKLRQEYAGQQTRRSLMLTEAEQIAKAVGQTDPVFSKSEIVGTYEPPLYMFGTNALKAEKQAIEQRANVAKALPFGEDHFIEGLPEILFKIEQLKALDIDYSQVKLGVIDEYAVVPLSPIKPKKLLVVALACVAGVFVGMMMALIMAAFQRHKEARREARRLRREQAQAE